MEMEAKKAALDDALKKTGISSLPEFIRVYKMGERITNQMYNSIQETDRQGNSITLKSYIMHGKVELLSENLHKTTSEMQIMKKTQESNVSGELHAKGKNINVPLRAEILILCAELQMQIASEKEKCLAFSAKRQLLLQRYSLCTWSL